MPADRPTPTASARPAPVRDREARLVAALLRAESPEVDLRYSGSRAGDLEHEVAALVAVLVAARELDPAAAADSIGAVCLSLLHEGLPRRTLRRALALARVVLPVDGRLADEDAQRIVGEAERLVRHHLEPAPAAAPAVAPVTG